MTKASAVAAVSFLLLFPAFYLYHQLLSIGVIQAYLGGLYSIVSIVSLILMSFFINKNIVLFSSSKLTSLIIFSFFFCCFITVAIKFSVLNGTGKLFLQSVQSFTMYAALLLVGMHLDLSRSAFSLVADICVCGIFLHIAFYVLSTGSVFYYAAAQGVNVDGEVASYQGFSRSALLVSFISISTKRKISTEAVVFLMSLITLFVLGARSEFVGFVLAYAALWLIRILRSPMKIWLPISTLVFLVFFVVLFSESLMMSRHAELLNVTNSSSVMARNDFLVQAWTRINDFPILGAPSGHVQNEELGMYAHNLISTWDAFGLYPFLVYTVLLLVLPTVALVRLYASNLKDEVDQMFLLVSVLCFVLALFAKSVFWPLPALAWGLFINSNFKAKKKTFSSNNDNNEKIIFIGNKDVQR